MEQFNLESYLANPNQRVVTRDGREVRILCTDLDNSDLPVAFARRDCYGEEVTGTCTKDGRFYCTENKNSKFDLFFAPEKRKEWTIICKAGYGVWSPTPLFETKEEAEKAKEGYPDVISVAKVEWEE